MQKAETVKRQYQTADMLKTRMEFQGKYSVNRYGFGRWLTDQYAFPAGARVLELGCGTGGMWRERGETIEGLSELVLTDFSEGMLREARGNLPGLANVRFAQVDIREIPFDAASFDYVIANMMLYHVDDKRKALSEVRRVLAPGGTFACATYGEIGLPFYMRELLAGIAEIRMPDTSFTLQNGAALLRRFFAEAERRDYEDHFEIDNADAVIEYLLSLSDMLLDPSRPFPAEAAREAIGKRIRRDGFLAIPKEYGTFLAK